MQRRDDLNLIERLYFVEIICAVSFTFRKLLRNLSVYLLNCVGLAKMSPPWITVEYPNSARQYYPRFRGAHRLLLKDNGKNSGDIRCTACFLCSTICPANCIYIEPQEGNERVGAEKFPKRFEINTLQCIYCGFCIQACPVDAIRMDTGIHPEIYARGPGAFIETKETLMQRSKDMQAYGIEGFKNRHMDEVRKCEIG